MDLARGAGRRGAGTVNRKMVFMTGGAFCRARGSSWPATRAHRRQAVRHRRRDAAPPRTLIGRASGSAWGVSPRSPTRAGSSGAAESSGVGPRAVYINQWPCSSTARTDTRASWSPGAPPPPACRRCWPGATRRGGRARGELEREHRAFALDDAGGAGSRALRHHRRAQLRGPILAHGGAARRRLSARARPLPGHHRGDRRPGGAGRARRRGARGGRRAPARGGLRRRAVGLPGGARGAAPAVGHTPGARVFRGHAHVARDGADLDRERPPRRAGATRGQARAACRAAGEVAASTSDRSSARAPRSPSPGATSRPPTTRPASPTSRSTSRCRWRCGWGSARRARSRRCSPPAPSSARSRHASGEARRARPPPSAPSGAAICGRRRAMPPATRGGAPAHARELRADEHDGARPRGARAARRARQPAFRLPPAPAGPIRPAVPGRRARGRRRLIFQPNSSATAPVTSPNVFFV